MRSILPSILFILSYHLVIGLLTLSLIIFLFTLLASTKVILKKEPINLTIESLVTPIPTLALVITNASIKNNVATSIAHIHIHNYLIIKILHHTINVMSTKAELFAIRCGINQHQQYFENKCHHRLSPFSEENLWPFSSSLPISFEFCSQGTLQFLHSESREYYWVLGVPEL